MLTESVSDIVTTIAIALNFGLLSAIFGTALKRLRVVINGSQQYKQTLTIHPSSISIIVGEVAVFAYALIASILSCLILYWLPVFRKILK